MKKKLSLLLTVVLAMMMVMGIGVAAFADPANPVAGTEWITDHAVRRGDQVTINVGDEITPGTILTENYYKFRFGSDDKVECWIKGEHKGEYSYEVVALDGGEILITISGESNIYLDSNGPRILRYTNSREGDGHFDFYFRKVGEPSPFDKPAPCEPSTSEPAHVHNFQWQIITEPSKDSDGLEGEMCSCGAMRNTEKISAYAYSLYQYAMPMINNAKSGQTITFEFGEWNSFPKSFMEKIAAKSMEGVTFVFHYKWNHEKQEITIPFGTAVDTQFDWYGPAKMAELYGMN